MGWADLPADIAAAIADRLAEVADLARFRSVCPSWRSASAAHAARRRVPLLLLPTQSYGTRASRHVWCPADDSLREAPLPAAARGRSFLFGSHHGWALAVADDLSAVLVHPFTGATAGLPALPLSRRGDCEDPVPRDLVWDWSPHGVAVVSPGNGAFFCRPGGGDASWRRLRRCSSAGVRSVTYCDGAFYLFNGETCEAAVVDAVTLAVAELKPPALKLPRWDWEDYEANLVVSPDELLLLVRTCLLHRGSIGRRSFTAFRADRAAGGGRSSSWSEVAGIGDRAVFVDHIRAFCVEANGLNGVRSNCIYVATSFETVNDDYGMDIWGVYSVSVLNLADLTTENLGYGNLLKNMCGRGFWQWPSWSLPNPR